MRVLITGANGFIGQSILVALKDRGIDVVAIGRTSPLLPIKHIKADLLCVNDFKPILSELNATHLIHLAWYTNHAEYWTSPLNLRWLEVTTRLVEAFCLANGQQVVIAGTCAEYDWSHEYCREESTPLNPSTLYGRAKDATRRLVIDLCKQHHVRCAWGRLFLPFGHGESSNRLIPSLVGVFRGQRLPFSVNANACRDFLHISDAAEGFITLLTSNANGAYNICSGKPTRIADIVIHLAHLLDANPQVILDMHTTQERKESPSILIGDNMKLRSIGWQPALTLTQGLQLAL